MLKSYIISALRSLYKNRYYSAINIFGLAIGLASFILIGLFVRHELSYDRYNDGADNIYRIVRDEFTCSPPPMAGTLKEAIPEIQFGSRFIIGNNLMLEADNRLFIEDNYYWTDNEFFKIFSVEFTRGSEENVLISPTDAIISESIANKFFGAEDPIGKTIVISREHEYRIAGVFKDFPANSHFHFNIVLPIERYFQITRSDPGNWGSNYTYSYVKIHEGADMSSINLKLQNIEKELTGWTPESGNPYEQYFFFQPVTEIHLHSHRRQEVEVNSDIRNVIIFSSIGLLILLIASINYINLTSAISGKRHREVGLRKVMGIRRSQLFQQFLTESVIVSIISTVIATIFVFIFQSYFANLMDREISVQVSDLPVLIPLILILSVMVGVITGLFPSRSLSRVNVISIIKGSSANAGGGIGLRNSLVFVQFIVAIVLIIMTINVQRQLVYIVNKDPGYDKEQIITLRLFDKSLRRNIDALKTELALDRGVLDVSTSSNLPNRITYFTRPEWFCDDPQTCTPISYNSVDYSFVDLYNIEIVNGRNFSTDYPSDEPGAFIVNERAVKMAGWDSPIGMELTHYDGRKGNIVGVVKDFHFQDLHADIAPLYLMLDKNTYSFFSIKIDITDIPGTLARIEKIFNEFSPGSPFQYTFFDEEFEKDYNTEKRLGSVFLFFSILSVILGCLGMFGMSAFSINQRTREMGVRKVFGATNRIMLIQLVSLFMGPVVLANVIAWPLAYYGIDRWLGNFAFRTSITIWSFIWSAIIVAAITILTISFHIKKIALQTPASSLRHQ